MAIKFSDRRIAKQNAAATIRLQAMFVGINHQRIGLRQSAKAFAGFDCQIVCQTKITPVSGIRVQTKLELLL